VIKSAVQNVLGRVGYQILKVPAPDTLALTHPDLGPEFTDVYRRCHEFTMTGPERMFALSQAVAFVVQRGIPGDIVECGVWRGGSSMVSAYALDRAGETTKRLWLYDTFAGMSEPTERDVSVTGEHVADDWNSIKGKTADPVFAYASLDDVQANMATTPIAADRLEYVQGKVEDTIPAHIPERISLLRLDTDWYESTKHELEHLWERLQPGGVLIIDDYGHWEGAREAVDEFFAGRNDAPLLNRIDYTGRIGVKEPARG
jgi:O-methyltransferase